MNIEHIRDLDGMNRFRVRELGSQLQHQKEKVRLGER
jgi:hypothetical protein